MKELRRNVTTEGLDKKVSDCRILELSVQKRETGRVFLDRPLSLTVPFGSGMA
jgi:hypothetical protein